MSLLGVFDSQVCGGKRYDLATMGRRRANATYLASHGVDESTSLIFGMDLTPLMETMANSTRGNTSRVSSIALPRKSPAELQS